jgi:hypothetical protein
MNAAILAQRMIRKPVQACAPLWIFLDVEIDSIARDDECSRVQTGTICQGMTLVMPQIPQK